jgi:mono/diheme cytochrome c family protein
MKRLMESMATIALLVCGCHRDMRDQPRYEPLEASDFFADGQSARPTPEGTVARGQLNEDEAFYTGKAGGSLLAQVPLAIDRPLLDRGRQRFGIYCSPCHGYTGSGDGMIVRRGFRRPPSYHIDRLRDAPAGHYFDVMTRGFGAMPSYAAHIQPHDRWAIAAYIRALQLSQHADLEDVPPSERAQLEEARP